MAIRSLSQPHSSTAEYFRLYYHKNKERIKTVNKTWRLSHPQEWKAIVKRENLRKRLRKYGLTLADKQRLWDIQQGLCACCGTSLASRICIDHDHKTGKVRGLLCLWCNTILGFAKDDIKKLESAARYLHRVE